MLYRKYCNFERNFSIKGIADGDSYTVYIAAASPHKAV